LYNYSCLVDNGHGGTEYRAGIHVYIVYYTQLSTLEPSNPSLFRVMTIDKTTLRTHLAERKKDPLASQKGR
jgi:hypothetical protein